MTKNKYHWYDGWFYDKVIAPNQDKLFEQITSLIEPGSGVIDIGCGTGRLAFSLAAKCKTVLGIDLSERNIDRARFSLSLHPDDKISFQHHDISDLISNGQDHFDFAVFTYVIHEVPEEERITLLNEAAIIADKIIIGDYLVPKPGGFGSFLSEVIEFIAGSDHYKNYRSYMSNGGISFLAEKAGFRIINEISNAPLTNHIIILAK
jgi:SAM-dependent methyltransferase